MSDKATEDRGDDFVPTTTPEQDEAEREAARAARDNKGRFVKKEAATDDGEVGEIEEDAPAEETEEAEEAAPAEEAEETEEPEAAEEESEEEVDETAAAAARAAPKAVPYSRFKEVVEQRKALQQQLAELASKKQELPKDDAKAADKIEAELSDLYEKVEAARADGDTKTAASLQRKIDGINRELVRQESVVTSRREAFVAQQNTTYNSMLDYLEQVRPVMDPDAPEFDHRVVKELDFQVKAYEKMGMPPTEALHRACVLLFDEDPFARPTKAAEVKPNAAKTKTTNVEKNIAAAKRTPPSDTGRSSGTESGKIVASRLSDAEFDALPESKKRELRGDVV